MRQFLAAIAVVTFAIATIVGHSNPQLTADLGAQIDPLALSRAASRLSAESYVAF